MYYYKTLRCSEALSIIDLSRVKFRQIFYPCSCVFHQKMYEENVRGRSLNFKTKQLSDISDISINNRIRYVDELTREQNCSLENSVDALYIPAFVLLNMLDILCSRPSDLNRAQIALDDLEVLIHYDEMEHIPKRHRDVSWEILGICQQITGNHRAAYQSYQRSLEQIPFHKIQSATVGRMQDLPLS